MNSEKKERLIEMFKMRLDGSTYQEIADKYGVTRQFVHQSLGAGKGLRPAKYDRVIYKGLRVWMSENEITVLKLHRMLFSNTNSNNTSPTRDRLTGKRQFQLSEIIFIINESGLTFEELFMQDEKE